MVWVDSGLVIFWTECLFSVVVPACITELVTEKRVRRDRRAVGGTGSVNRVRWCYQSAVSLADVNSNSVFESALVLYEQRCY